ncbi:hypothetical protein [Sphingomonas sp.]|uniref:hypothetical protein n=1 Tax=Sphingomonas sp. TaxID=28214 RepID=UPI003CC5F204
MSQPATPATTGASQPGQSLLPDWTGVITTAHLVLIAVLTVLVLIALVYGARLHRARSQARREVAAHNEALRDEGVTAEPAAAAEERFVRDAAGEENARLLSTQEPVTAAPPTPAGSGTADGPVTQLKGLGPRVAERLAAEGITTVGQIAALTDDDANALDARLGPFTGRMGRDRWLEQARFLAAGDVKGFEAVFGRL